MMNNCFVGILVPDFYCTKDRRCCFCPVPRLDITACASASLEKRSRVVSLNTWRVGLANAEHLTVMLIPPSIPSKPADLNQSTGNSREASEKDMCSQA